MTISTSSPTDTANAAANTAAAAAGSAALSGTSAPSSALGEQDFLNLLTTELQNQDPTQPVDDTQMIAQLATFSQLSATNTGDATLSTISNTLDSIQASQLAAQQSTTAAGTTGTGTDGTTTPATTTA